MLVHTGDLQRTTRFFYERCPQNHGRLITFFQFLREKNFVRDLSLKEMEELKQTQYKCCIVQIVAQVSI